MIKLRIQGTREQVTQYTQEISRHFQILEQSTPYANRGNSQYVRVYMDVGAPRECEYHFYEEHGETICSNCRELVCGDCEDWAKFCPSCGAKIKRGGGV